MSIDNSFLKEVGREKMSNANIRNGQVYKVPAFFIRRRNATQTLLFSHGNAEDLGMMYTRMKDLAMVLGVNIMAYDYTGYGLSMPGPAHPATNGSNEGPSENMIYRNIEAAFHYLTSARGIPPHQIVLYGRSLGSGPSCYLAAKTALQGQSVGGLILHSPFLSVYKVVADLNGMDMTLVGDLFHNEKRAKNIRCPTLIIHGRNDEVVPFWHAPRLLAAIPEEFRAHPYYVEGMGHNHIESRCRQRYLAVVTNFLKMGVWSNSSNTSRFDEDIPYHDGIQQMQVYRGPNPIPINERALPSETKENTSFYVNKTWLRHAKVLIKEVLSDAGCYANSTDDCGVSDGAQRSDTSSRGSNTRVLNGHGVVDARDEDEFAPSWRSTNGAGRRQFDSSRQSSMVQRGPHSPRYNQRAQSMSAMDFVRPEIRAVSVIHKKFEFDGIESPRKERYGKSHSMQLADGLADGRRRRY